jgi:hypothetical protein
MNREEREHMVDRLLNEALAPQAIEPRAGLEQRIVANLRAQPEPRPWRRWLMVPAIAGAVIAVVAGVALMKKPQPAPVSTEYRVPSTERKSPETATTVTPHEALGSETRATRARVGSKTNATSAGTLTVRNRPSQRPVVAAKVDSMPRQEVFPSPVPMTDEEKMLLTLLRRNPSQAVLVAREQAMEWERILNNFQNGEAAAPPSSAAPDMR